MGEHYREEVLRRNRVQVDNLDTVVGIVGGSVDLAGIHGAVGILDIVDVLHMDSCPVADHILVAYSLDVMDNHLDIEDVGDKRVGEGGVHSDEDVMVVVLRLAVPVK